MVKNFEGGVKFLMYPRFVQVFLDKQPQKKQPKRKQRKDTEVSQPSSSTEPITYEAVNEEHVPTHSNDPLLSGEDRLKLNKLMELCTNLSQKVLDLENTKTSQAAEITKLKERVKKLERRNKSRTPGLKRLRMVGRSVQAISSKDEEVTLVNEAQERNDDNLMFDTRTLIKIKAAKPKAVTTAATTTTTTVTRPKARGVVVQEPKEEKLAKQREEDANIAEWDNVQAMIDADYELATRLQAQEQEELTVEEKSKLFVELMDKRKKHFAILRAKERRRKPPTKSQKRNQMCTYLKNKAGFTYNQLKNKSFDEVQKAFNKTMGWIDSFVSMDSEVVKGGKEKDEGSVTRVEESNSKRAEEIAVDAIPLATKPPITINWKIIKKGKMGYFQIIRADGSSRRYSSMIKMLQKIDREDLETLWKLVKAKHGSSRPEEAYERVL
ncbi:hypothetical protein Tco_1146749 [Tanacetum coccineum]